MHISLYILTVYTLHLEPNTKYMLCSRTSTETSPDPTCPLPLLTCALLTSLSYCTHPSEPGPWNMLQPTVTLKPLVSALFVPGTL